MPWLIADRSGNSIQILPCTQPRCCAHKSEKTLLTELPLAPVLRLHKIGAESHETVAEGEANPKMQSRSVRTFPYADAAPPYPASSAIPAAVTVCSSNVIPRSAGTVIRQLTPAEIRDAAAASSGMQAVNRGLWDIVLGSQPPGIGPALGTMDAGVSGFREVESSVDWASAS